MDKNQNKLHDVLRHDLQALKLTSIADIYAEMLDEAATKQWSMLQLLVHLMGHEAAERAQRALARRIKRARLPKMKTLEDYDFNFPKRIAKQKILRLFDCDFVDKHGNVVFVGNQGTGKIVPIFYYRRIPVYFIKRSSKFFVLRGGKQ